ncbi:hypothetical protein ASD00_32155 [Ensifer sp. Root31]|nr:hypothetical protein ASD00_32155 [Ensifer sp. Root31]
MHAVVAARLHDLFKLGTIESDCMGFDFLAAFEDISGEYTFRQDDKIAGCVRCLTDPITYRRDIRLYIAMGDPTLNYTNSHFLAPWLSYFTCGV